MLRVYSLLSPLNDASRDTANEGFFQFSSEADFASTSYVHSTLAIDTEAESPYFAQLLQC